MAVKVIGSSSRLRILDPFVQFGHPPIFPSTSSESPLATRDNSSTPRLRRIIKGGDFKKTTFEIRPDCVGPLVLAQMFSSTEEALRCRRSALSGQGVVSHDHYRESGTRSATAVESIRNTYQNVRTP